MENTLLQTAISIFGSEAKLASAIGVTQPAIQKAKRAKRVSAEMAVKIDSATKGRVARWMLRPDLWDPPRQAYAEATQ